MLKLSRQADYALLLLSLLARERTGTTRPARELAEQSRVPAPMVAKVLKGLVRAGLATSTRGVTGGYALARAPETVTVLNVIEAMEGPVALTECSGAGPESAESTCEQACGCPVRGSWQVINEAIVAALARVTLAQMTCPVGDPVGAFHAQGPVLPALLPEAPASAPPDHTPV